MDQQDIIESASTHPPLSGVVLQDIEYSYEHFKAFFQDFTALDTNTDFDALSPPNIQGTMIDTPCGHVH